MNENTLFVVPQMDDIAPGYNHYSHDMHVDPYGTGVFHYPTKDHVDHSRKIVRIEHKRKGDGRTHHDVIVQTNLEQGDILIKRAKYTSPGVNVDLALYIDDVLFYDNGQQWSQTRGREQYYRDYPSAVRNVVLSSLGTLDPEVYYIVERGSEEYTRLVGYFVK